MTNSEIKQWIKNIIHTHRNAIADEGLSLSVDSVWHCYMENSDDTYVNVCDAFALCGYDIRKAKRVVREKDT